MSAVKVSHRIVHSGSTRMVATYRRRTVSIPYDRNLTSEQRKEAVYQVMILKLIVVGEMPKTIPERVDAPLTQPNKSVLK